MEERIRERLLKWKERRDGIAAQMLAANSVIAELEALLGLDQPVITHGEAPPAEKEE